MSYTINPNAKNKWARNAENTMDLSLETDASSVYLDNGRTLEQEIGEGSMVSSVATIDSAMSKVIDGTLDGAYESCVFKGKSLVNLMTGCKDEYVVRYHDPSNPKYTVANISMMKPNTEYTLFYKAKYRLEGDGAGEVGSLHIATSVEQGFIGTSHNLTTEYKQYVFKLTTTSTVDCFTFKSNGSYFAIKECVLLEGDYTNQDVPFFEGLCDVKMPILRNIGKNLFDLSRMNESSYIGPNALNEINLEENSVATTNRNSSSSGRGYVITGLKIGVPYTVTATLDESSNTTGFFQVGNRQGTGHYEQRREFTPGQTKSWEVYSDVGSLKLSIVVAHDVSNRYIKFKNIQIEESPTPTTYEPHKSNILRTSEEIVLREVGGVYDTYNPLTGEYVRRIGEVVLDGSEDWIIHNNDHSNRIVFKTSSKLSGYNTTTSIADKIRTSKITTGISNLFGYSFLRIGEDTAAPTAGVFLHLEGELTSISNVAKLIEWLQANPITVQYELKTPITTIVESLTTPFAYENGHIILESGYEGQSLLPMLEYSTVVNKTGQIKSVAKTIQKQEKQLTMLEQMLIQNIINLDYNNTLLTLKNEMEEML